MRKSMKIQIRTLIVLTLILAAPAFARVKYQGKKAPARSNELRVATAESSPYESEVRAPSSVEGSEEEIVLRTPRALKRKGWLLLSAGLASHSYSESGNTSFRTMDLSVGADYEYITKSRFAIGASGEFGVATATNDGAKEAPSYLSVSGRAGYVAQVDRWDLGAFGGIRYRTMLGKTREYGYERIVEPFLSPVFAYSLGPTNLVRLSLEGAAILNQPFSLEDREMGARLGWYTRVGRSKLMGVEAGYSLLQVTVNNVHVKTSELALRFSFGW